MQDFATELERRRGTTGGTPSDHGTLHHMLQALDDNLLRVIDLFRSCDIDNSGMVDRNEFFGAMITLGFSGARHEVDCLFDVLDADASGAIQYKTLHKAIRSVADNAEELFDAYCARPGDLQSNGGSTMGQGPVRTRTDELQSSCSCMGQQAPARRVFEESRGPTVMQSQSACENTATIEGSAVDGHYEGTTPATAKPVDDSQVPFKQILMQISIAKQAAAAAR